MTNKEAAHYSWQRARVLSRLASISRALRAEREVSFYGDEESGLPPEMLYVDADADEALEKARFVLTHVGKLVEGDQQVEVRGS